MKKLISKDFTVDPNRLFQPSVRTLEHLQEAYGEMIDRLGRKMIGSSPSGGYIMEGVVDTVTGSNHSITAGSILFYLNFTAWSNVTTYAQFATVSKGGFSYVSSQASNLNHDPSTSPTYWNRVGKHQEVQLFLVDAQSFTPLADTIVAYIDTTYITGDPARYTDGSTANVHATYKIKFKDDATGTGISDFSALNDFKWHTVGAAGEPAFENSFVSFTSYGNSDLRFKKVGKRVFISGAVTGNSINNSIFTLPLEYRPSYVINVPIVADNVGSRNFSVLKIDSGGVVTPIVGSGSVFILDGCNFWTD